MFLIQKRRWWLKKANTHKKTPNNVLSLLLNSNSVEELPFDIAPAPSKETYLKVYASVICTLDFSCPHSMILYWLFLPALGSEVESQIWKTVKGCEREILTKRKRKEKSTRGRVGAVVGGLGKKSDANVLLLSSLPNSKALTFQIHTKE